MKCQSTFLGASLRRLPCMLGVLALALGWMPISASADCALIPTALQPLPSTLGSVDRPFAAPGDTVRLFSVGACDPTADQFDPDPANNVITLSFPGSGADDFPGPGATPVTASATADCGEDRCFAIEFVMPDTANHSIMSGTGEPLAGPIEIRVTNTTSGTVVAEVGPLFEPTAACNPQNRFTNLFETFTLLPPRNSFATATSGMRVTVDGSGALLIPLEYLEVLTSFNGGSANLRLLTVDANVPNGLGTPIPEIPAGETANIRIPRDGDFVRSFSFEGRPIPPLLEVTSTTPALEASGYGDRILGSVDFVDSVIRIAKTGPDPNQSGQPVQIFALNGEQVTAPGLLEPLNGGGPIFVSGLSLGLGPAAPLNSLNSTGEAAAIAVDESIDGDQNDGDVDDLVVAIIDLDSGQSVNTGLAVLEVAQSPRKPAIKTRGSLVGFLQSEANDGIDQNMDGDMVDGIPVLFDKAGTPFSLGAETADPSARIDGKGPLALTDNYLFYLRRELDESGNTTLLESVDDASLTVPTLQPALSADQSAIAYAEATPVALPGLVLDLADIVGGGDGTGTGTANTAIDIATGAPTSLFATGVITPTNTYVTAANPFVDGVFVPDGGVTMTVPVPISSTGLTVSGLPNSILFGSASTWDHIRNGTNTSSPTLLVGSVMGVHASKGITFDLDAIEAANSGQQVTSTNLTAAFGNNASGAVGYYVYLDGVLAAQADLTETANGTAALGDIPIGPTTRFLTLVTSARGIINNDWSLWLDPTITLGDAGLRNGSFESALQAGPTRVGVSNLTDWLVGGGSSLLEQGVNNISAIPAQDGLQFLSMGHSGASGTVLLQDVPTEVGVEYTLRYWVRAIQGTSAPTQTLTVAVVETGGGPIAVANTAVDDFSQWNLHTLLFTATTAASTISFIDTGGDLGANIALDNISLSRTGGPGATTTQQVYTVEFPDGPEVTRISENGSGEAGNGDSSFPTLSGDGRQIAYLSLATNLVDGGSGVGEQVYWRDRDEGTLTLVSEAIGGGGSNGPARNPEFSTDGSTIAYISAATNLALTGTLFEVYAYDTGSGLTELISVDPTGNGSGSGEFPYLGVSDDGQIIAFASDSVNLIVGDDDTNGGADVFVRDREAGTTQRVSVGRIGESPNGPSTAPHISGDGNRVVFVSEATNLTDESDQPSQCYVYDRTRKTTQLVSRTLGGDPVSTSCQNPRISGDGRFVAFHSDAPELTSGLPDDVLRTYRFDIVTGVVEEVSVDDQPSPAAADAASSPDRPGVSRNGSMVAFSSIATNLSDSDGPSFDVFSRKANGFVSLNGDFDTDDRVLSALRAGLPAGDVSSPGIAVSQLSVAGDRALFVDDTGDAFLYQPASSDLIQVAQGAYAPSLSEEAVCLLVPEGNVAYRTVDEIFGEDPLLVSPVSDVEVLRAVRSLTGNPLEAKCVFSTVGGDLYVQRMDGGSATFVGTAEDFQVDPLGIAFRTCEDDAETDLNGDGDVDAGDCEMRFWSFGAEEDLDPTTDPLFRTQRTAVPCDLPGCDPFFEPYRIRGNVLSFVSREPIETDINGGPGRGVSCLPTSPTPGCDVTGDNDSDDLAVQIVNVFSENLAAQVFPISETNPPQVAPFPEVSENGDGLLVLQLPAGIVPGFEGLPSNQLVTVIGADSDGDGTFDTDGVLNPAVQVIDNCSIVPNANQVDRDGDGLGAECDTTLGTQQANDDPLESPEPAEVPGQDLCDLDRSDTITQLEVDRIWLDRGVPIAGPRLANGLLVARDNRDPDADGQVTAVDYSICQFRCNEQPGGCPPDEPPTAGATGSCGLGFELIFPLLAWAHFRRRIRS